MVVNELHCLCLQPGNVGRGVDPHNNDVAAILYSVDVLFYVFEGVL